MNYFYGNIEKQTLENKDYRKVIFTGKNMQLVLMCLQPNDIIPLETHHGVDQFFRVESGICNVIINNKDNILIDGYSIIIPSGATHKVINLSMNNELKLYTIYAPPQHPSNRIDHMNPEKIF